MRLRICCLIIILAHCFNSHGQTLLTQSKKYDKIPKGLIRKSQLLAQKDTTDMQRFYRICEWICKNKKYDVKEYEKIELYNKKSLTKIWRDKTLRPIEYSRLLEAMCKQINIPCYIIEGYGEDNNYSQGKAFYYNNHQWNIAKADTSFLIVDLSFASGFFIPKISLIGKLKKALNLPYLPKHLRFIPYFNTHYIITTAEEFRITHLPVHPMWQLNEQLLSIDAFKQKVPQTGIKENDYPSYPYLQRINVYNNLHPTEQLLMIANEGYIFNSKNNFLKGTKYFEYATHKWFSASSKNQSRSTILSNTGEIKKYAAQAEIYLKKFQTDNERIKNYICDSLTKKNREIVAYITKQKNYGYSQGQNSIRTILLNNRQNTMIKLSEVKRELDRESKTNSEVIFQTQHSQKQGNSEIIKNSTEKIANNNKELNACEQRLHSYNDSILNYRSSRTSSWDSILYYEREKIRLIKMAALQDLQNNNITELREIHKKIDKYDKQISAIRSSMISKDALFNSKILNKRDSIISAAMRKVAHNKQLLVFLKKNTQNNSNENSEFIQQNTILHKWYDEISSNNTMKITIGEENINYSKTWIKVLKAEGKVLKKYAQFENYTYNRWINKELFRFKKYDSMVKNLLYHCTLLKNRTEYLIKNSTKN